MKKLLITLLVFLSLVFSSTSNAEKILTTNIVLGDSTIEGPDNLIVSFWVGPKINSWPASINSLFDLKVSSLSTGDIYTFNSGSNFDNFVNFITNGNNDCVYKKENW